MKWKLNEKFLDNIIVTLGAHKFHKTAAFAFVAK